MMIYEFGHITVLEGCFYENYIYIYIYIYILTAKRFKETLPKCAIEVH